MHLLDSIIAFTAVILAACLAVTAGTQLIISFLALRGANLRRSLADLFENACDDADARRYGKVIAHRALRHPLLSGSVFSHFRIRIEDLPYMPADAAGKLRWVGSGIPLQPWLLGALGGFFVCPATLAILDRLTSLDIYTLSNTISTFVPVLNFWEHPWRTGAIVGAVFGGLLSRWRLATSVRPEELVAVLEKLSTPPGGSLPDPAQRAMLVIAGEAQSGPRSKINSSAAEYAKFVRELPDIEEEDVDFAEEKTLKQATRPMEPRLEGVNSWFDHAMLRASQRFTVQARVITVALSLVLVFAAHLDAIRLFRTLSSDAQVRAQLAGSADAMMKQASTLLRPREDGANKEVVPDIYRKAMVDVLQIIPHKSSRGSKARSSATAAEKLELSTAEDGPMMQAKERASKALEAVPGFASREDAVSWLRATLNSDPALDILAANYEQAVNSQLASDADKLIDRSASLQHDLANSELQLIPEKWLGWKPNGNELPGLLLTLALLSLGASVCYNLLKSAASLRPVASTGTSVHSERRIRREDRRIPQTREQIKPQTRAQAKAPEKSGEEREPAVSGQTDRRA
ncbi:MAG: hypothetical protein ACRD4Y_11430 [Candidatus Acidiferrales bacterium]